MTSCPLPVELQAKLDACEAHTKQCFEIAEQHRVIYMSLNQVAAGILRPFVDHYIRQNDFKSAEQFIYSRYPDTIERVMTLQSVYAERGKL